MDVNERIDFVELGKELKSLEDRHKEICDLPIEKFLSKEIGEELAYIHKRMMEITQTILH